MAADKLSCESTLYWRCLCEHLRSLGAEADDFLDKVLPTGIIYAKFLHRSVSVETQRPGRLDQDVAKWQLMQVMGSILKFTVDFFIVCLNFLCFLRDFFTSRLLLP